MRDDDLIMRDVENIPEQTHREGRMAIREQELDLAPLAGDPAVVSAARETRYRILEELSDNWKQKYAYRAGVMKKPGLLGALKRKEAQFWFQHRDFTPEEAFLSELFGLEPVESDSPLMADARLARYRLLWDLLALRLKKNHNLEAVKMAGEILAQESPEFWYKHMNFSADELVKLHFPDIKNWLTPSERASKMWRGGIFLTFAVLFSLGFLTFLVEGEAPICVGSALGICAVAMFGMALGMFFSIKGSWRGKGLYGKLKK